MSVYTDDALIAIITDVCSLLMVVQQLENVHLPASHLLLIKLTACRHFLIHKTHR